MIPYGKQDISDDDIDAVIKVLKSDFVTQGPKVPEFENSIKKYCNVKKALAVNSATSGLHIACLALGVGSGDTVWTSSVTFAAASVAFTLSSSFTVTSSTFVLPSVSSFESELLLLLLLSDDPKGFSHQNGHQPLLPTLK